MPRDTPHRMPEGQTRKIMKRAFVISTAVSLVLALTALASAATKVFVLAGQSNMAGEGGYSDYMNPNMDPWTLPPYDDADAPCPAPYNQPLTAVKFWNYLPDAIVDRSHNAGVGNGWIPLQNGYGNRDDGFGPELSFGAKMHEMYPNDEICLVKFSIGGTNLGYQWNPANTSADSLYLRLKGRVNAALANLVGQGKTPTVAGMLWMQGEDDSTNSTYAFSYATNLKNLITSARTDFNAPDMKFVAGRISYMSEKWAPKWQIDMVRSAQWNIGSQVANASCVNTDDLEWAFYGHYGTQGQIDLGNRYAAQFAPVPEPSNIVLACIGMLGLLGYVRRKRKQS
jgi:hypothetical protein